MSDLKPGWLQRQVNSTSMSQCALCGANAKTPGQPEECFEAPFRRADHVDAMSEIIQICKKAMNKTVGEPWVALDKVSRLASRQLLLMKTPMQDE
jgi:hypothetical protein